MHNKRLITGITVLLTLIMSFPTFANGNRADQSVVIGEAPGRVTSSVDKSQGNAAAESSENLSTRQVVIKSSTAETTKATTVSTTAVVSTTTAATTTVAVTTSSTTTAAVFSNTVSETTGSTSTATSAVKAMETNTVPATKAAETTKAPIVSTAKATTEAIKTTTASESSKVGSTESKEAQSSEGTKESQTAQTLMANANFRPAHSAIVSSANNVGPGVKATTAAEETTSSEKETDKLRKEIVDFARKHVGVRYRWGGANLARGVDCSGLTSQIYKKFGIAIGRTSRDQAKRGRTIPLNQIKPGDLLIYADHRGYINHVTMYLGDGKLINASSENTGVIISDLGYRTPLKAVRFIQD